MTSRELRVRLVLAQWFGWAALLLDYLVHHLLFSFIPLMVFAAPFAVAQAVLVALTTRLVLDQHRFRVLCDATENPQRTRVISHLDVPAMQAASAPAWISMARRNEILGAFFPCTLLMRLVWRAGDGKASVAVLVLLDRLYPTSELTEHLLAFADRRFYRRPEAPSPSDSRSPAECLSLLRAVAETREALSDEVPEFVSGLIDGADAAWNDSGPGPDEALSRLLSLSQRIVS